IITDVITMDRHPWGITLNLIFLAIAGVVALFGALALILAETAASAAVTYLTGFGITNIVAYTTMGGVALIVLAVVAALLFYGLWQHNDVAWWACIFLLAIGIGVDVLAVIFYGYTYATLAIAAIAVNLVLIFALLHRDTIAAIHPDIDYRGWVLGT
ncbi:unnamed protein product, partial [marine sediment metagenome]